MAAPQKPDSRIRQWSTTPASNGTSPNVVPYGWPEGMAPSSVNDTARQQMADHRYAWEDAQWFSWGDEVSKASGTTFKIASDVTSRYLVDRRIKIFTSSTLYATINASSYSAPDTTVGLTFDNTSDTLGASFTAVSLAILTPTNSSLPATSTKNRNLTPSGNFDMNPWQRGTTFTSAAHNTFGADRWAWYQFVIPGVVDYKKTADGPTLAQCGMLVNNCLHIDVTTADASIAAGDFAAVGTHLEGFDFSQIAQRPFTISFWHKHTKTGTYCVAFRNSGQDRSYVAEYTQAVSDTWEYTSITVSASPSAGTWDYTNGNGLGIYFSIAMGSTYQTTANTWASGNYLATSNQVNGFDSTSNNFKLALIQVEQGSKATQFELTTENQVVDHCRRYYMRRTSTGANSLWFTGGMQTTTACQNKDYFTKMRTVPTFSWDGTNGNWYVIVNSTTIAISGLSGAGAASADSGLISATVGATSVGYSAFIASQTSSAWCAWSAEFS